MTEPCTLLKFKAGPHCALNLFLSATGSVIPVERPKRLACGVPSAAKQLAWSIEVKIKPQAGAPLCGNCINLVNENDGRSMFLRDSEHFPHLPKNLMGTAVLSFCWKQKGSVVWVASKPGQMDQFRSLSEIFLDQFTSDLGNKIHQNATRCKCCKR